MLSNQILGMAGMLCLLRTHKVLLNGKRQLILVTRTGRKADGWGAKSGNWSSQRNNPGRPPRRPDERGPPPPRQRFELTIEEKNILLEVEPIIFRVRS